MKRDWMLIAEILNEVASAQFYAPQEGDVERGNYHLQLLHEAGYLDADGWLTMKGWDFHELSKMPTFQRAHDMLLNTLGGATTDLLIEVTKSLHQREVERQQVQHNVGKTRKVSSL